MFKRLKLLLRKRSSGVDPSLRESGAPTNKYYQNLHDKSKAYNQNNWLLGMPEFEMHCEQKRVGEIGCGNGMFSKHISQTASDVFAFDWAKNKQMDVLPPNVSFVGGNILEADLSNFSLDIIVSGDVLEHFTKKDLSILIPKLVQSAEKNFHVIACFDDGHSHLTVESADWWLNEFQRHGEGYHLEKCDRPNVAIVTNLESVFVN